MNVQVIFRDIWGLIFPQHKVFTHIISHFTDPKVSNLCSVTLILRFPLVVSVIVTQVNMKYG